MDKNTYPLDPARAGLRASDAEREQVATLLRENFTDGRLTLEELQERLERAYTRQRRIDRHQRRMDRRFGPPDERE